MSRPFPVVCSLLAAAVVLPAARAESPSRAEDLFLFDYSDSSQAESWSSGPQWFRRAIFSDYSLGHTSRTLMDRTVYDPGYVGTLADVYNADSFVSISPFMRKRDLIVETVPLAPAATRTWQNNTQGFSAGTSWVGGIAPAAGDIAEFSALGFGPVNPLLSADATVSGIRFVAGAYGYAFNGIGNILTIGADGIDDSADNAQIFTGGIQLRISTSQTWTNNGGVLNFNGSVDLNSDSPGGRTLTIAGSGNTTFNGSIIKTAGGTATGSLVKTGTGTLTLAVPSNYNGGTTVNQGTLLVVNTVGSGTGTGPVAVSNFGTFLSGGTTSASGGGGISGPVQINSGAALSPGMTGNGAGTTAILRTGDLTLAPFSNLAIDLNGVIAGSSYDQVAVTGLVDITGSILQITLGTGFTPNGQSFVIVSNDGTDLVTGTFALANLPAGYTIDYFFDASTGSPLGGNDIALVPIPEVSTWISAALALGVIGFAQRRRLRAAIAL